ncbi:MAG: helix-turn-helix domain-containing protein [Prevotella sp.]|nr:helix-turn-helix domain-containing protein [Prevotella sp.]
MDNIEIWNDEINLRARHDQLEQDIVVLEDVHDVPIMNTEYHTHYYYIGMCKSGRTKGQYDYQDTDFKAGDICWIMPDHVISHNYVSDDYSVLSVYISKKLFQSFQERGALGKLHYPIRIIILSLSPEQFQIMANGFRMMGQLATLNHPKREELLTDLCRVLSTLGDNFISQQYHDLPQHQSPKEELFEQFYELLVKHYRESHKVTFYARKLCLTPKYFATRIKKTTGIAASEWIDRYVLVEAKWLLRTDKSIQQIAYYLGFSEQSSFSRFFKSYAHITPTEYREQVT